MPNLDDKEAVVRRPSYGGVDMVDNLFVVFRNVVLNIDDDQSAVLHAICSDTNGFLIFYRPIVDIVMATMYNKT